MVFSSRASVDRLGTPLTYGTSADVIATSTGGRGLYFPATSDTHGVSFPLWSNTTDEASVVLRQRREGDGWTVWLELGGSEQDHFPFGASVYSDAFWSSRWINGATPPASKSMTTDHVIVLTVKNGEQRAYWDGSLWATATATGGFTLPPTGYLGGAGGTTSGFLGWIYEYLLYDRVLSPAEARSLSENIHQVWQAPARRLWGVSSGGTNYTLTAVPAAFALAGTAANLEYHRLLAATQGSFAVSATAATLKRGYALQADPASFALSGADAGLRLDRVLQADSAASQIAGTDASLEYNRVLSAESASFQIVGTDATFVHDAPGSYTLSAESASFGIAAQPATLKYNRRLSADSGSLAFTGSAASLRYARAVIAEAAVYALTGTDATFRRTGGPEPIISTVKRTAVFRAAVERAATFQRRKQVNVRFN